MYQQVEVEGINEQCKGYVARCKLIGRDDIVDIQVTNLRMYTDTKKYYGEAEVTRQVGDNKVTLVVDIDYYSDKFEPLSFIAKMIDGIDRYYDNDTCLKDLVYHAVNGNSNNRLKKLVYGNNKDEIVEDTFVIKLDDIGHIKRFIIDDIVITITASKLGEPGYEVSYLYKARYYDDEDGRDKLYKYIRFLVSDTNNNKLGTIDVQDRAKLFNLLRQLFSGISIIGQEAQSYEDDIDMYPTYVYSRKPWRHIARYDIQHRYAGRFYTFKYLYDCGVDDDRE